MNIDKVLMIHALKGKGAPLNGDLHINGNQVSKFSGDQHNENWTWIDSELEKLSLSQLKVLYYIDFPGSFNI